MKAINNAAVNMEKAGYIRYRGIGIISVEKFTIDDTWHYALFPIIGQQDSDYRIIVRVPVAIVKFDGDDITQYLNKQISSAQVYHNEATRTYSVIWCGAFIGTVRDRKCDYTEVSFDNAAVNMSYMSRRPTSFYTYASIEHFANRFAAEIDRIPIIDATDKHCDDIKVEYEIYKG